MGERDLLGMAAAPEVGSAGQGSYGTGWPSTAPAVSVHSHKPEQTPALTPEQSPKGEEDPGGTLSL